MKMEQRTLKDFKKQPKEDGYAVLCTGKASSVMNDREIWKMLQNPFAAGVKENEIEREACFGWA